MIDWTDPKAEVSKYFTVREALFLPKWARLASQADGLNLDAQVALQALFLKMDVVREFLNCPILVHVAYRPTAYNLEIGGAKNSAHIAGLEHGTSVAAVDWSADLGEDSAGENCDALRAHILPQLEEWGLRMEDNPPTSPWIHLDSRPVPEGGSRYFKP